MDSTLDRVLAFPAPVLLIASVAIVSLLGWVIPPLQRALVLNPYRVRHNGAVHRLLTAGWVHTGVFHLGFNMLWLYFFAEEAMRVLGPTRLLVLYVSAVVVSFIPTTLRYMQNPRYASLGASGAVAAVMFSAILLNPKLRLMLMFLPIPLPGVVFGLVYLVYSAWASSGAGDGIDHFAHFAGAVYGALFTYLIEPARVEHTIKSFF